MENHKNIILKSLLLVVLLTLTYLTATQFILNSQNRVYKFEPANFIVSIPDSYYVEEKRGIDELEILFNPINRISGLNIDRKIPLERYPQIMCRINNIYDTDVLNWIRSQDYRSKSGLLIDDSVYPSADIKNVKAIGFKTDGLYVSDHVLFKSNGYSIDCSVEYITFDDKLRIDFVEIVSTIKTIQ